MKLLSLLFLVTLIYLAQANTQVPAGGECEHVSECATGLSCYLGTCTVPEYVTGGNFIPRSTLCKCSLYCMDSPFHYWFFCPSRQCYGHPCVVSSADGEFMCSWAENLSK